MGDHYRYHHNYQPERQRQQYHDHYSPSSRNHHSPPPQYNHHHHHQYHHSSSGRHSSSPSLSRYSTHQSSSSHYNSPPPPSSHYSPSTSSSSAYYHHHHSSDNRYHSHHHHQDQDWHYYQRQRSPSPRRSSSLSSYNDNHHQSYQQQQHHHHHHGRSPSHSSSSSHCNRRRDEHARQQQQKRKRRSKSKDGCEQQQQQQQEEAKRAKKSKKEEARRQKKLARQTQKKEEELKQKRLLEQHRIEQEAEQKRQQQQQQKEEEELQSYLEKQRQTRHQEEEEEQRTQQTQTTTILQQPPSSSSFSSPSSASYYTPQQQQRQQQDLRGGQTQSSSSPYYSSSSTLQQHRLQPKNDGGSRKPVRSLTYTSSPPPSRTGHHYHPSSQEEEKQEVAFIPPSRSFSSVTLSSSVAKEFTPPASVVKEFNPPKSLVSTNKRKESDDASSSSAMIVIQEEASFEKEEEEEVCLPLLPLTQPPLPEEEEEEEEEDSDQNNTHTHMNPKKDESSPSNTNAVKPSLSFEYSSSSSVDSIVEKIEKKECLVDKKEVTVNLEEANSNKGMKEQENVSHDKVIVEKKIDEIGGMKGMESTVLEEEDMKLELKDDNVAIEKMKDNTGSTTMILEEDKDLTRNESKVIGKDVATVAMTETMQAAEEEEEEKERVVSDEIETKQNDKNKDAVTMIDSQCSNISKSNDENKAAMEEEKGVEINREENVEENITHTTMEIEKEISSTMVILGEEKAHDNMERDEYKEAQAMEAEEQTEKRGEKETNDDSSLDSNHAISALYKSPTEDVQETRTTNENHLESTTEGNIEEERNAVERKYSDASSVDARCVISMLCKKSLENNDSRTTEVMEGTIEEVVEDERTMESDDIEKEQHDKKHTQEERKDEEEEKQATEERKQSEIFLVKHVTAAVLERKEYSSSSPLQGEEVENAVGHVVDIKQDVEDNNAVENDEEEVLKDVHNTIATTGENKYGVEEMKESQVLLDNHDTTTVVPSPREEVENEVGHAENDEPDAEENDALGNGKEEVPKDVQLATAVTIITTERDTSNLEDEFERNGKEGNIEKVDKEETKVDNCSPKNSSDTTGIMPVTPEEGSFAFSSPQEHQGDRKEELSTDVQNKMEIDSDVKVNKETREESEAQKDVEIEKENIYFDTSLNDATDISREEKENTDCDVKNDGIEHTDIDVSNRQQYENVAVKGHEEKVHQQLSDDNNTRDAKKYVVNNDETAMEVDEDRPRPHKEENRAKKSGDIHVGSNEEVLEKQQQMQQNEQQQDDDAVDDDSSSSSTYSTDSENEYEDENNGQQAFLSLMQRREKNMQRHQNYRNALFLKYANITLSKRAQPAANDNDNEEQQQSNGQTMTKEVTVALESVGSSSGISQGDNDADKENSSLLGRKKRRRGMLFGTSYNNIKSSFHTPYEIKKDPSISSSSISIAPTETRKTTKTLMKDIYLRYPYRSPQIRILHSVFSSTVRQSSNSSSVGHSRVYVPPSVFVTGPSGTGKSSVVRDLITAVVTTKQHSNCGGERGGGVGHAYVNCATLEPSSIATLLDSAFQQIVTSGFSSRKDGHVSAAGTKKRKRKNEYDGKKKKQLSLMTTSLNDENMKDIKFGDVNEVVMKPENIDAGKTGGVADTPMSSIILGTSTAISDEKNPGDNDLAHNNMGHSSENIVRVNGTHESVHHYQEEEEEEEDDDEVNQYGEDMEDTVERVRKQGKKLSVTTRSASARRGSTAMTSLGGNTAGNAQNSQHIDSSFRRSGIAGAGYRGSELIVRFGRSLFPFCGSNISASGDENSNTKYDHTRNMDDYHQQGKGCAFLVLDHADRLLSLTSKKHHHHQQISTNERNNFLAQLLLLPKVMELNLTIIVITNNTLLEYSRFNNVLAPQAALGTIRDSIQPITVHFHAYRGQKVFKAILKQPTLQQLVIGITDFEMGDRLGTLSCVKLREKQKRLIDLLYNSMVSTLVQSLESSTRDVREFVHLCRFLWPQYISPLFHGDLPDGRSLITRLICSFPSDSSDICEDKDCLHCSSYESSNRQELQKTRADILEMLNRKVREFIRLMLAHNLFMPGRGDPDREGSTSRSRSNVGSITDLPYQSKFLLMSGYLCQNNKADRDASLYTNQRGSRRTKKSVLSSSADNLAYASKNYVQHIRASRLQAFPLERMFSIFSAIFKQYGSDSHVHRSKHNEHGSLDIGDIGTYHLFIGLSHLRDLGLLQEISRGSSGEVKSSWEHVRMEHANYLCTLSRKEAMELAESLNFPISNYLKE